MVSEFVRKHIPNAAFDQQVRHLGSQYLWYVLNKGAKIPNANEKVPSGYNYLFSIEVANPIAVALALKRTGRFDKKIPFFAPTEAERELVFKKRITKTSPASTNIDYADLAKRTRGFTQAEIEGVVVKALELAIRKGINVIRSEDLNNALMYMYSAQNAKIVEMENIALLECNDVEFLPDDYIKRRAALMNN
jgi:hypothetical protein